VSDKAWTLNGRRINEPRVSDSQSPTCHFKGLNLLGMDTLERLGATVTLDPARKTVVFCVANQ